MSSITSDDGNGNVSTIRFSYSDGLYSFSERKFMGFGKAVRTLPDSSRVESFMRQDFAGKGLVTDQKIYDPAGELNRHTHNTYTVASPFSGSYFHAS